MINKYLTQSVTDLVTNKNKKKKPYFFVKFGGTGIKQSSEFQELT